MARKKIKEASGAIAPIETAAPRGTNPVTALGHQIRAARKSAHQAHGALPERDTGMNMMKAFGVRDGYHTDSFDEYRAEIAKMTSTDLQAHAHEVGVIPLDPRDKLVRALEAKFQETKARNRPAKTFKFPTRADKDPAFKTFMGKFMAGDLQR